MSTAIMNMALDLLDEEPIASSTDDRTAVRWMNRNYDPVRDMALRVHPWNFAKRRAQLAARQTGPAFGFRHAYAKPADCLRVLPLASLGGRNGAQVDFSVDGPDILTNAGAPLRIMYIARITDTGQFDALFTPYLACTLGARAANFITSKQSYAERCGATAKEILLQAQMVNGLEGVPEDSFQDDWVTGRHVGVTGGLDDYGIFDGYGGSSNTPAATPAPIIISPVVNVSMDALNAIMPYLPTSPGGSTPRLWLNVDTVEFS